MSTKAILDYCVDEPSGIEQEAPERVADGDGRGELGQYASRR